jgi:hypothetical protein
VEVKSGETTVAAYEYDGLNRRIVKTLDANTHYDCFYNASWQLLEVRKNDYTNPLEHYLWSLRYIDAPVIRWRDGNTDGDCSVASDGDSIVHYLTDANPPLLSLLRRCSFARRRRAHRNRTTKPRTASATRSVHPRRLGPGDRERPDPRQRRWRRV